MKTSLRNKLTKFGALFLGLAMGLGVAVGVTAGNKAGEVKAAGVSETLKATEMTGNSNGTAVGADARKVSENSPISYAFGKGSEAGTAPTFYDVSGSATIRMYVNKNKTKGDYVTITSSGTNYITSVSISGSTKQGSCSWVYSKASPIAASEKCLEVTATLKETGNNKAGQYTLNSITVTYEKAVTNYTVSFAVNTSGYGTVSQSSITNVPSGTPIEKNDNTVTINGTIVTATPAANTAQYTYAFTGWSNGDGTITAARTITANFTRTVNSCSVGGTIGNGKLSDTSSVSYSNKLDINIEPSTNYTYPETLTSVTMGGSTLTAGSGYTYDSSTGAIFIASVTGNVVINATCVPLGTAYTVTYNANGGSVSTASEEIIENGNPSFPTPTRSGFNFKGWQVDGSGTLYTESSEYTVTGDVNFVASWAAVFTVTFNANGGSVSPANIQVEEGNTFSFPSAGTKTHYTFDGWSSDGGTNKYKSGTSPAVTANTAYTAYWIEDAKYTVTYVAGSSSYDHENQYSGTYTLLPFNQTGLTVPDGYRFKDYTVNGEHKEAETSINLTGATTVTANFEEMPRVDTLNRAFTGVENGATSYAAWTGKTGASGAVYAGQSAGSNNSIQLRSTSPAGIITTTSGGTVKKITVVWESHSANGRTIDIYGKNTAYTESGNLYASDETTKGTKLGSIVYGTSTELTITGDYEYIGIRSNSSALYLSEIQIEWQAPNALTSVSTSGQKQSFTAGETFSYGGTLTAHYSVNADATVTPKEFRWGSATGSEIDATKPLTISDNGKVVYVIYEEGDVTVDTHYSITVSYKPASGIELDYSSYKLPLNGSFELTATVSDEYANPEAVSWSSDNEDIALVDETGKTVNVIAGENLGTAVITATANGHSASCTVTVSADAIVALDRESIEAFSGDDSITLSATAENFDEDATLNYDWEIVGDSGIVTLSENDDKCTVSFVAGGTVSIKVTVSDGTTTKDASCSVVVTQSEVTNLTLTSSVDGGAIYNGPYLSTLTLTPNMSKSGNATKTINWTKSNNNVNISATQTSNGDPITVNGVTAGTTVITATSAYTSSVSATYTVTVTADGVTSLSWGTRGTIECFEGTKLKDAVNTEAWEFTPTWISEYEDTPEFGTGENDVHIGLYETSPSNGGQTTAKSEEATPISADYSFTALDNGKVIAACYRGTFSTNNKKISIIPLLNDISEEKTEETTENESVTFKLSSVPSDKISSSGNEKGVDIDLDANIHLDGLKGTGTTPTRFWVNSNKTQLRTYKGNQLKFTASNGYKITKITCSNIPDGSYTNADGETEITFDAVASQNSNDIVVEYIKVTENTITVHYTNTNIAAQKAAVDFAHYLMDTMDTVCKEFDTTSGEFETSWDLVKAEYTRLRGKLSGDDLTMFDQMIKKVDTTGGFTEGTDILQKAMYRYDIIVERNSSLAIENNGVAIKAVKPNNTNKVTLFGENSLLGETSSTTWIIAIIALAGIAATGGYFYIRKRKED